MGKRKILLPLAVGLPVLIVVGAIAFVTKGFSQPLMLSISVGPTAMAAPVAAAAAPELPSPVASATQSVPGVLVDLGSKVVNLADPGGYRYLRIGVVIELTSTDPAYYALKEAERGKEDQKMRTDLTNRRALVDDVLITCVSDKTFGDIFTMAGKDKLREELRSSINERLGAGPFVVSRVYFTDFVIN